MEHTATIRSKLEDYIKSEGITLQRLAEKCNLNAGTLSAILHASRPISMRQLDQLIAGIGLAEGEWYEMYITECVIDYTPNWRRLRPFLYRCMELDKLDLIEKVISPLSETFAYVSLLFETAEDFFRLGKYAAARILYESVAESERYQHSERLAVCQYRLFIISIGQDQQANLRAAAIFEGYVDRLNEEEQLDALKELANLYSSLRVWEKLYFFATEMGRKATIQYKAAMKKRRPQQEKRRTFYPLFLYIQYSYLLQGDVLVEKGEYEEALSLVDLYEDSSWVKETSEEIESIKQKFQSWAKANRYMYKVMMGDGSVLPEYIAYLKENEDEVLTAMVKIIKSANQYGLDVDHVLKEFETGLTTISENKQYTTRMTEDLYMNFFWEIANYYLLKQKYKIGLDYLLNCLATTVKTNNASVIVRCVNAFEKFRYNAANDDVTRYQNLIKEVTKHNEI
jgi:transcriptional regulator with XRE-family HTH domain